MSLPGFTAEASVYEPSNYYYTLTYLNAAQSNLVTPQLKKPQLKKSYVCTECITDRNSPLFGYVHCCDVIWKWPGTIISFEDCEKYRCVAHPESDYPNFPYFP
jgi:hypothetical protein